MSLYYIAIFACLLHVFQVEMLIHVGADLSAQDADGNTVLHDLVQAAVEAPHNEMHVQVQ